VLDDRLAQEVALDVT